MPQEVRNCQNCEQQFTIEPEDFSFYERIKVPPPTFCPECRLMRRYAWRNERSLFKQQCDNCKRDILSGYPQPRTFPVFCHDCWISDAWDPMDYGRGYDFSRPFFAQWEDLMRAVPRLNLFQMNSVNSPYSNIIRDSKDCYLSFSLVGCEEVFYSKNVDRSRQLFDCLGATDSEQCAGDVYMDKSYNVHHSFMVRACLDSLFLFDCHNARHCFMSANLRNREYVFRNRQLTKDAYEAELASINTGSAREFTALRKEFDEMRVRALHKYADIVKSVRSTGNALANAKNARACFEAYDLEDVSHVGRAFAIKDSMDVNNTGLGSELLYEYVSGGKANKNLKFTVASFGSQRDCIYTGWCNSSSNLFGCFGLKDKQYCILNKQYTKEDYEALVPKIIAHMDEMPYISQSANGKSQIVYKYSEFFPMEVSPFAYNESLAYEHFPLTREETERRGYRWHEPEVKNPHVDIEPEQLPDDIRGAGDDILENVIGCAHRGECLHQCTRAFRVAPRELQFYHSHSFPLPRLCPNCRHYARLALRNPWKLWSRRCQCAGSSSESGAWQNTSTHFHGSAPCPNEFETSYAPDRPEIIYCESCYNAEIA